MIIVWIAIVSLFAVFGAYYAKYYGRPDALIAFYVTAIIFSNLTAQKSAVFNLGFMEFFAPVNVLIFSITFLLTDIVNEKFGRAETQRMIGIAVFAQVAIVLFTFLIIKSESSPFFQNQLAFETVLGNIPRIVFASLTAFFISENADAYIFQWFRRLTRGRHLWMRNIFSSLPSMLLDSVLFMIIAFYGVMPIGELILGLTVVKWLVGIVDIPFMYLARAVLGRTESIPNSV